MTMVKVLLMFVTIGPFAAHSGPYGPFGPDEDYVVALDACEGSLDVRQAHPPLGTVDFSRNGDEARLRITMVGISHYEAQVFSLTAASGASSYDRLIALSFGDSYRFWVIPTMDPMAEDFVTFGKLEPIVMVTRGFVQKRDWPEEPRSYFVYDLWTFHGGELVSANSVDSRFPKWVRYTLKPNWRPAISLTEDDKRRLRSIPRPIEAVP